MKPLFTKLDPLLIYWRNLSARERMLVGGGGAVLGVLLFYGAIWAPIQANLTTLRKQVPQEHQQVQWMRAQVERVKKLQASAPAATQSGGLLSFVERSAQSLDLQKYVKRVEPEGQSAVRLVIDGIPFNDLINWLATLQKQGGMRVDNASIEPLPTAGTVNARLLLRTGS
jgi:general secretion pathway protein M